MDKIAAARAELWEAKRFLENQTPSMKEQNAGALEHIERAIKLLGEAPQPAGVR